MRTHPENNLKPVFLRRNRLVLFAMALIVLVALSVGGCYWWTVGRFIVSTDDAYVRADVITVSARVPGYVVDVAVQDNQWVHRGDVLARLDDQGYQAKVARAQATVAAALADLRGDAAGIVTLDARIAQQSNVIAAALADVKAAAAGMAQRRADDTRYRQLAADDAASTQKREQAHAAALLSDAALEKANADVRSQRDQRLVLEREKAQRVVAVARAQAEVDGARAALRLAQLDLTHTTLVAEHDGAIGERAVRAGQYVEAGQPLLAVVPLHTVYVVANFKETEIADMRAGQTVEIDVDTFSGRIVHGRIAGIAPGSGAQFALLPPDNATGNFTKVVQRIPVKIALDEDALKGLSLRPGMSVTAKVDTRTPKKAMAASTGATTS